MAARDPIGERQGAGQPGTQLKRSCSRCAMTWTALAHSSQCTGYSVEQAFQLFHLFVLVFSSYFSLCFFKVVHSASRNCLFN